MRLFLPRTVLDRIAPADIEQRPDALHVDGEGDGQAFTERAAAMLCAVFRAAKREEVPCLPYVRDVIRLGLRGAGARLDRVDRCCVACCWPIRLRMPTGRADF